MKKIYKHPMLKVKKLQAQVFLLGSDEVKINYDNDITVDDTDDVEVL